MGEVSIHAARRNGAAFASLAKACTRGLRCHELGGCAGQGSVDHLPRCRRCPRKRLRLGGLAAKRFARCDPGLRCGRVATTRAWGTLPLSCPMGSFPVVAPHRAPPGHLVPGESPPFAPLRCGAAHPERLRPPPPPVSGRIAGTMPCNPVGPSVPRWDFAAVRLGPIPGGTSGQMAATSVARRRSDDPLGRRKVVL